MKNYTYQNSLIGKKQLRQLLAWSFTNYDSMQACALADELKYLGFQYASQAGISISIEDLKIPFVKNVMLEKANQEIRNAEKIYLKGKITDVERFQKIIDTWSLTSESLKDQIIYFFKNYDPLNSVYIMAFSGARGNLSQVRQLVGMRGLMSDPSGQIMNLPIKKNFREGLTITDYLMSGYGARKGIVDTALKTANSGYLTRRLIDVAQDILIREKDCLTNHSFLFSVSDSNYDEIEEKVVGRILSKSVIDLNKNQLLAQKNTQITPNLLKQFKDHQIKKLYIRSPLTCNLYRAICQKCYGWDLANENLVDIGEAIGILAGQSIGEPGTQLTMRTFHTGGIFTSEARQQIISPLNGIIQYYKTLKTVVLRTNRGEDVLVTKNSGSLVLIPDNIKENIVEIEVLRNTILFPKNNQYILKDTVIGELINANKQTKVEIKPILSDTCGEIFIPKLKQNLNVLNNNKLIWILSGQFYNSPLHSFLNFYPDYKLNKYSYIFRTKLINHYNGSVNFMNHKVHLPKCVVKINNHKYFLKNTTLTELKTKQTSNNALLQIENFQYLINIRQKNNANYLHLTRNETLGTLVSNTFQTLTGGTVYYNFKNLVTQRRFNQTLRYYNRSNRNESYLPIAAPRTLIWLGEEFHEVNCEPNILLVEHGDFISKGFELIPGLFSKTSGLVNIIQKNNVVKTILIKSGLVYEGKKFKKTVKKLYYPGETLFFNIPIKTLSFCESITGKTNDQLLLRPIEIYEFGYSNLNFGPTVLKADKTSMFDLTSKSVYSYKPNQIIKGTQDLRLVSNLLHFKTNQSFSKNITLQLLTNQRFKYVRFNLIEKLRLTNYIPPSLRYQNIQSCFLIQEKQFLSNYTTLGYLEAVIPNSLEIVKVKIKKQKTKQIFLISNDDCLTIRKSEAVNKKLNDFIVSKDNLAQIGKIIIENKDFITIQKGRPYFFPNCKNENLSLTTNIQYKLIPSSRISSSFQTHRDISLKYHNIVKLSVQRSLKTNLVSVQNYSIKSEFSKLFIKNTGKLYSCLVPQFFKKFRIQEKNSNSKINQLLRSNSSNKFASKKVGKTLLMQSSDLLENSNKDQGTNSWNSELTLVKFVEQPFTKSTKAIGLYSITEDYFEQDVNSVFCKNTEFIEAGKTIGLLNLEKEITGDIVQGLPRIEEILEARKKNIVMKRVPTSQKKGLLIQKTSLDTNFEFKKLGTTIQENDKINPHKLLKVYFNYYGSMKYFLCDQTKKFKYTRLLNNYEGSYKSFKKVQLFILNAVQSVYQSQGVTINDKHLEVIIKQMTTKVLITYEGETPLLRREVIDLYHIEYINKIIQLELKQTACYIPLLLGITKAALNNPSFISAASFQETTRVLTKAAIEGRIDWLRGLKENIIIGHLIPSGTGTQNYRNSFQKSFHKSKNHLTADTSESFENLSRRSRQVN
uniref:DNA-directed RNA polymerase subunit beta'' n=1 Tax=Kryptoperidinium foliaceum TaxID=160619 RepID=D7PJF3_9DINO|nr:RNA polymerase beta'' subunit [Kryptoperidinium foliaceum]ADI40353.1 RNA polymerase beta'' subunit [Kryptoperidinium foliaceum]